MKKNRFIVTNNLIDGTGNTGQKKVYLAIKDGLITDIGPAASLLSQDPTAIDDLSHCIILPPLIDCSVHLTRSPSITRSMQTPPEELTLEQKTEMMQRHSSYCSAYGVLGVAEGDDITSLLQNTQDILTHKSSIDIKISYCPHFNGQGYDAPKIGNSDFLKIYYSADIGEEKKEITVTPHEDLRRILAHKGKKKAVVIANGRQQVAEALEAGCDAIEQGYGMGEENLRRMAEKGVLWIPSVLRAKNGLDGASAGGDVCCRFSQRYVAPGKPTPGAEAFWKKVLAGQIAQLKFAREAEVKTAVGTGAGSVGILHGESVVEEMKLFIKAGYSLEQTVHCASEAGANFFNMEKLGALTVGSRATFLITRGTAQQLPRKLSFLEGIYVDGAPSSSYQKTPTRAV